VARLLAMPALQRREYKYLIDEQTAERIRRYIDGICSLDRYAATGTGRYRCDTLYFDSLHMNLYRATLETEPIRHKLRIRGYPDAPDAPVFLEVKRRVHDVIIKTRAPVRGNWANRLDEGTLLDHVATRDRYAAENFLSHYEGGYAGPMVPVALVRYEREPYFSRIDEYARVTFDRKLCFQTKADLSMAPDHDHWTPIDNPVAMRIAPRSSLIVLELKFQQVAPGWMQRMVQALELRRDSHCKYTRAIDSLLQRPEGRIVRFGFMR
jgi:hypothetical protein